MSWADDLQADGQPGRGEPAWHAQRGLLGQVERIAVRRPTLPVWRSPAVWHVLPDGERCQRKCGRDEHVVAPVELSHQRAQFHPGRRRVEVVRSRVRRRGSRGAPQPGIDPIGPTFPDIAVSPQYLGYTRIPEDLEGPHRIREPGIYLLHVRACLDEHLDGNPHRGFHFGVVADEPEVGREGAPQTGDTIIEAVQDRRSWS